MSSDQQEFISDYFEATKPASQRAPLRDLSNQRNHGRLESEKYPRNPQVPEGGENSFHPFQGQGSSCYPGNRPVYRQSEKSFAQPEQPLMGAGKRQREVEMSDIVEDSQPPHLGGDAMDTDTPQHQRQRTHVQGTTATFSVYQDEAAQAQQLREEAMLPEREREEEEEMDTSGAGEAMDAEDSGCYASSSSCGAAPSMAAVASSTTTTTTGAPFSRSNREMLPLLERQMEEEEGAMLVSGGEPSEGALPSEWSDFARRAAASHDPQLVPEYRDDIYNHQRQLETKHLPNRFYMNSQTDINPRMRGILFDWLVEVGLDYNLSLDTLHLSFNYIDRYLSRVAVNRTRLQLVGITCMFLAAKYEEIMPPSVDSFVYMTENTYDKDDVFRMEVRVLRYLEFNLSVVTSHTFVQRLLEASSVQDEECHNERVHQLCSYFLELAAMEYEMIKWYPSIVTTSAIALARFALGLPYWNAVLEHESRYTPMDVSLCMQDLLFLWKRAANHRLRAVPEKYRSADYGRVALLPPPQDIPEMFMLEPEED